jgi:hypothetical protein
LYDFGQNRHGKFIALCNFLKCSRKAETSKFFKVQCLHS